MTGVLERPGASQVLTMAHNINRTHDSLCMDSMTTSDELAKLASEVRRLRPDWRDAEAFYEQRSEISVSGAPAALVRRIDATTKRQTKLWLRRSMR